MNMINIHTSIEQDICIYVMLQLILHFGGSLQYNNVLCDEPCVNNENVKTIVDNRLRSSL